WCAPSAWCSTATCASARLARLTRKSSELELAFPAAMAALGLASGVHCAGMCGGIVTAFSLSKADRNREQQSWNPVALRLLVFNAGRISSYALGGAIAAGIGSLGWYASGGQAALSFVASVAL